MVALARAVKENQGVMVVGLFGAFTDGQRPVVYGNATGRLALFVSEAFHLACEAIIRRS